MKKLSFSLAASCLLVLSFQAQAQTKPIRTATAKVQTSAAKPAEMKPAAAAPAAGSDYYVGKWNITVEGTPQGDGKMVADLVKKDGKLGGTIITKTGEAPVKITSVEEKPSSITLFFPSGGYDVNLTLMKKDDTHVTGNVMDMFDAKGERAK